MVNKGANFVLTAQNKGGAAMKQFQGQLQGIKTATSGMMPVNRSWNKGLSENRRAVQQLGFQMTDFTVQIAGGQNAMLAFIQQGGQVLQVFGPVGAILATLLTVFGTLALVIGKSGKSLSELTPIVGVLTDQFQWLADAFMVVANILIDGINLILNNLDTLLIVATIVAGWFAGGWVIGMIAASNAVRALVFSIAMIGPAATASMILLTPQMGAIAAIAGVTAAAFALFGSTIGTLSLGIGALTYALIFMRGALMTLLPYALIAGIAWLIERFLTLKRGAGSFGEAMRIVGAVATEVFDRMGLAVSAAAAIMRSAAWTVQAAFMKAFDSIKRKAYEAAHYMATALSGVADWLNGSDRGAPSVPSVDSVFQSNTAIAGAEAMAGAWTAAGKVLTDKVVAPLQSVADLQTALANGETGAVDVRDWFGGGADKGKGGGGGAADKVKEEVDKIKKIFEDLKTTISGAFMSAFKGLLDGTKSLKEAMMDILGTILDKIIEIMMQPIFDGIASSIGGSLMGALGMPSFAGGGSTGNGSRSGGVDGQGGFMALLHPKETVLDHTKGQSVGGGGGVVELRITEGSMFGARVEAIANDSAIKITREAVQEYDDRVLPVSVKRISANPRRR